MSEREQHAIEASLRRQFEPPRLDALVDRIAAAAAAVGDDDPDTGFGSGLRLVVLDDSTLTAADAPDPRPAAARPRFTLGVLAAIAAAAAIVLLLARPRAPDHATAVDGIAVAPEAGPSSATVPTTRGIAGQQLHDFLRAGAYPQGFSPQPSCAADTEGVADPSAPVLPSSPEHRVVWECGGLTGIDCGDHDLPAQRLMVVQLMPAGPDVILCIEPPWADPEPELPAGSGYEIFRRTLGGYVLYEVTPLDAPRVVHRLTI